MECNALVEHAVCERLQFFIVRSKTPSVHRISVQKSRIHCFDVLQIKLHSLAGPFFRLWYQSIHNTCIYWHGKAIKIWFITWGLLSPPILIEGPPFTISCYWLSHTIENLTIKWWPACGPLFLLSLYTNLKKKLHFQYTKQWRILQSFNF